MTPLPPPLGRGELVFWRLDKATFASSWDSGEGAFLFGGRWNSRNRRVVYASLDPATVQSLPANAIPETTPCSGAFKIIADLPFASVP